MVVNAELNKEKLNLKVQSLEGVNSNTLRVMNHVSSHESRISIMPYLHHIATCDTEQSRTKVFAALRKKKGMKYPLPVPSPNPNLNCNTKP